MRGGLEVLAWRSRESWESDRLGSGILEPGGVRMWKCNVIRSCLSVLKSFVVNGAALNDRRRASGSAIC